VGSVLSAIIVILVWQYWMNSAIQTQNIRLNYLQQQHIALDKKIKSLHEIEQQHQQMLQRLAIVNQLELERGIVAEAFNSLPSIMPDSVYLTHWQHIGNNMIFSGMAQSNAEITEFMRNLDATHWADDANLNEIKSPNASIKGGFNTFTVQVVLSALANSTSNNH